MLYTTVLHNARKQLGISCNEYCIADMIHKMSINPGAPIMGWCSQSRGHMAEEMDLSRRSVIDLVNALVSKGLVEKNETDMLRTTQRWYDVTIAAKAEAVEQTKAGKSGGEESSQGGVKIPHTPPKKRCEDSSQGVKKVHTKIPDGCEDSSQDGCEDSSHKNKSIENNSKKEREKGAGAPKPPAPPPKKIAEHRFCDSPYYHKPTFLAAMAEYEEYARFDFPHYYETVKNWADSGTSAKYRKADWIATARGFMLRDEGKGEARYKAGTKPINGQSATAPKFKSAIPD